MLVRAINSDHDWTFGASLNNFKSGNPAVRQMIETRLLCFLNDCFFDTSAGIDWFRFLGGSKNQLALSLAVSAVILNTPTSSSDPTSVIVGISQLYINLDHVTRDLSISYQVQSIFSVTSLQNTFTYSLGGSV